MKLTQEEVILAEEAVRFYLDASPNPAPKIRDLLNRIEAEKEEEETFRMTVELFKKKALKLDPKAIFSLVGPFPGDSRPSLQVETSLYHSREASRNFHVLAAQAQDETGGDLAVLPIFADERIWEG